MSTQLKVGFHLTSSYSLDSILRDGLQPMCCGLASKFGETERGIHVFSSIGALRQFFPVVLSDWDKPGRVSVLAAVLNDIPIAENRGPSLVFRSLIPPNKLAVVTEDFSAWSESGFLFNPDDYFTKCANGTYESKTEQMLF